MLRDELLRAAGSGQQQTVDKALRKGASIDELRVAEHDRVLSLLMAASGGGQLPLVKDLLRRGASVDLQNNIGMTALMIAAGQGHDPVVRELLQYKASADLQECNGLTALTHAARDAREACVQTLLGAGANTELRDNRGFTALQHAEQLGNAAVANLIRGAEAAKAEKSGSTAVMKSAGTLPAWDLSTMVDKALREGAPIDELCEGAPIDEHGDGRYHLSLLMAASGGGQLPLVKDLLRRGASVDLQNNMGMTALMIAAGRGFDPVVRELLQYKASADLQDSKELTALAHAAMQGQEACVKSLLGAGANSELRDFKDNTALQHAEQLGHAAVANLIRGAEAEKAEKSGATVGPAAAMQLTTFDEGLKITPLGEATRGRSSMKSTIIIDGLPVVLPTEFSDNLINVLRKMTRPIGQTVELSMPRDVNGMGLGFALIEFCEEVDAASAIRKLNGYKLDKSHTFIVSSFEAGSFAARSEQRKKDVIGALAVYQIMGAALRGEQETVGVALWCGMDINTLTDELCRRSLAPGLFSLLMAASLGGQLPLVKDLLGCGASIDLQNNMGLTALMIAAQHGHESVVRRLLQHNANVDQQDVKGGTALMVAALEGDEACARALLDAGASIELRDKHGKTALQLAEHALLHPRSPECVRKKRGGPALPLQVAELLRQAAAAKTAQQAADADAMAEELMAEEAKERDKAASAKAKKAKKKAKAKISDALAAAAAPAAAAPEAAAPVADSDAERAAATEAADEALRHAIAANEYEALSRGLETHRWLASEAVVAEACARRDKLREKRKKESQRQAGALRLN